MSRKGGESQAWRRDAIRHAKCVPLFIRDQTCLGDYVPYDPSGEERTPRTLFAQVSALSYASAPLHSAAHSRVYAVRAPLKRRRLRSLRAERGRLCPRVPSVDTLGRAP